METYSLSSGSMEWSPKYARYMAIIMRGLFGASLKSRSQAALKSGPRPATSSSVGLNLPAERCQITEIPQHHRFGLTSIHCIRAQQLMVGSDRFLQVEATIGEGIDRLVLCQARPIRIQC
jgi:hypothetical protein